MSFNEHTVTSHFKYLIWTSEEDLRSQNFMVHGFKRVLMGFYRTEEFDLINYREEGLKI